MPITPNLNFSQIAILRDLLKIESLSGQNSDHSQSALLRIEQGQYGKCVKCQRFLSYKFLLANPAIEKCKNCLR